MYTSTTKKKNIYIYKCVVGVYNVCVVHMYVCIHCIRGN